MCWHINAGCRGGFRVGFRKSARWDRKLLISIPPPRARGLLLDQAATSAAYKNHLPRGTQLESREVRTTRLPGVSVHWVAENHLQREPGVAYLGIRVAYHAEGDSKQPWKWPPDLGATPVGQGRQRVMMMNYTTKTRPRRAFGKRQRSSGPHVPMMMSSTETRPHRSRLASAHQHQNPKENRPAIRESQVEGMPVPTSKDVPRPLGFGLGGR